MSEEPFRSWRATVVAPDGTRIEILTTREEFERALADTIRVAREMARA